MRQVFKKVSVRQKIGVSTPSPPRLARGMLPCKCVAGETHNTPTLSLQVTLSNVVGRGYTTQRNTDK